MGIPLKVENAGIDIGVDTAAASRRTTAKQKERINAAAKKALRTGILAKRVQKAWKLALWIHRGRNSSDERGGLQKKYRASIRIDGAWCVQHQHNPMGFQTI